MDIKNYIEQSIKTKQLVLNNDEIIKQIDNIANVIVNAYKNGNKVMTAGNGGSAGDAQHIAGELVSKFNFDRPPLAALELNTNSPLLTAISNDYGYNKSFARQIQANGKAGDVFIAISTSGYSENIIEAVDEAKTAGARKTATTRDGKDPGQERQNRIVGVKASHVRKIAGRVSGAVRPEKRFPRYELAVQADGCPGKAKGRSRAGAEERRKVRK